MAAETKIEERRKQLKLTYKELYFRTGLNPRTIKRYEERTSEPTFRSLVLLAYGLECESLAELVEDEWLDYRPRRGHRPLDAAAVTGRPTLRLS